MPNTAWSGWSSTGSFGTAWTPDWWRPEASIEPVAVLRQVLVQTYTVRTDTRGREVIRKREADTDGVPPGHLRLASPYDADARWSAKGDEVFWLGYKVHLTETCDTPAEAEAGGAGKSGRRPNLITDVCTTTATVPDVKATEPVQRALSEHGLQPSEHYLDSGYPSAERIHAALARGITMVTPVLLDQSPQARAATGYDKSAFHVDWRARQVRCPAGRISSNWNPVHQHGREAIVVTFAKGTCSPCPYRAACTTARQGRRMLTLRPRELHETLTAARIEQKAQTWKDKYALRSGIEGTINQALDVTGIRRARYRGLPKVRLQHAFSATAINVIRLDAHWREYPSAAPGPAASPASATTSRHNRRELRSRVGMP